jgi:cell division protein ZapE
MINNLIPPPRYSHCKLENYLPNPKFTSQKDVKETLIQLLKSVKPNAFFRRNKSHGYYLDGSFGVGKTHLLTAVFHELNVSKAYLSFTDLMARISYHGMAQVIESFIPIQFILIDEFELDDPANTMKASNFIREMFALKKSIITTSNTLPNELGKGRFGFKNFESEIGFIAEKFTVLRLDGPDYRSSGDDYFELVDSPQPLKEQKEISFDSLKAQIEKIPLVNYSEFAQSLDSYLISEITAFKLQDHALRFTHLIDKIYDLNISIGLHFLNPKNKEIFIDEFLNGAFQKKYKRCLSRLHELSTTFNRT